MPHRSPRGCRRGPAARAASLALLVVLLVSTAQATAVRPFAGTSDRAGPVPDRGDAIPLQAGADGTIVSDFEAGHGFVSWFPTGTVATERAARRTGETGLRLATDGRGGPVAAERRLPRPIDVRDARWRLWVRVDDPAALSRLWLQLSGDGWESYVAYPLASRVAPGDAGVWLPVATLDAEAVVVGEPRLAAIDRIRLRADDRGSGAVVVDLDRLALLPHAPRGAVSITFDDGWEGQARHALPIMERLGFAGTAFVVPYLIGTDGYLTAADLRALRAAGWDVAGHYHPSLAGREEPELSGILRGVRAALGEGRGAELFAYPQGHYDGERIVPAVARHFRAARTIVHGLETLPPADPLRLRAVTVLPGTTVARIDELLALAARERAWLILVFHRLVEHPAHPTEVARTTFASMMRRVAASGLPVRPMSAVLDAYPPPPP